MIIYTAEDFVARVPLEDYARELRAFVDPLRERGVEALEPLSVVLRLQPDAAVTRTELARTLAALGDADEEVRAEAIIAVRGLGVAAMQDLLRQALGRQHSP